MQSIRKKLLVVLATLGVFLIANVIFWVLYSSFEYKGIPNTGPWTPFPTTTQTISLAEVDALPSQTVIIPASPTSTQDPATNCTYSEIYWENHPESWHEKVVIASLSYTKDDITAAYETQLIDIPAALFVQLNSAYLNALNGADYSSVNQTIIDGANWLSLHAVRREINQTDQQTAIALGTILTDFNNGKLGPGSCAEEATPIPANPTFLSTDTVTPTGTVGVSWTPTKTARSTRNPTATLKATRAPFATPSPTQPAPKITPKKTQTSPPPTIQPTQPPATHAPPTSVPTSVPLPTQAPPTPVPTSIPLPLMSNWYLFWVLLEQERLGPT